MINLSATADEHGWRLDLEGHEGPIVLREEDIKMLFAAVGPVMLRRIGIEWGQDLAQGQMTEAARTIRSTADVLADHADRLTKR